MKGYKTGSYWRKRTDLLYYQYMRYMIRCIGVNAGSIIDVGSGNAPYLEWFDWIPEKVSVDLDVPYSSDTVKPITGNILDLSFDRKYDVCTCLQVLEHVPDPAPFARRLFDLSDLVLISVPHKWPAGSVKSHVNDPVDLGDVERWFGRKPNYNLIVREPFQGRKGERLFALFDVLEPTKLYGREIRAQRRPL
ncbi:MAG TPA: methyltransferase domain-containing protein [Allosphingosinicella sp.]|nr:methyltransferase domain-containing protein [Allosphingosinicella sp.]